MYKEKFGAKLNQASARVNFIWIDHETFKGNWLENAGQYSKAIVVVDEGDLFLTREIS